MHIEKFNNETIKKMYSHYLREHITENVDTKRTKNNLVKYNNKIIKSKKLESENIVNDIKEYITNNTTRKLKEKSVLMCNLIIHQPQEIKNTDGLTYNKEFFEKVENEFIKNYCKNNNFVMSVIHTDESQPHIHLSFIPLIKDNENKYRLSAKEYLSIKEKVLKYNKKKNVVKNKIKELNEKIKNETDKNIIKELKREIEIVNKNGVKIDTGKEPIINLNTFHNDMEKLTGYKLTLNDDIVRNKTMNEYKKEQELLKSINNENENVKKLENELEKIQNKINDNNIMIDNYKKEIREQDVIIEKLNNTKTKNNDIIDTIKNNVNDFYDNLELTDKNIYNNNSIRNIYNKELANDYNFNIKHKNYEENYVKKINNIKKPDVKISKLNNDNIIINKNDYIKFWQDIDKELNKVINENNELRENNLYNISQLEKNYYVLEKNVNELEKKQNEINNNFDKIKLYNENETELLKLNNLNVSDINERIMEHTILLDYMKDIYTSNKNILGYNDKDIKEIIENKNKVFNDIIKDNKNIKTLYIKLNDNNKNICKLISNIVNKIDEIKNELENINENENYNKGYTR